MIDQFGKPIIGRGFGGGRGKMGGDKPGSGPGGNCICPNCGTTLLHTTGVPCNQTSCPKCDTTMTKQ